jgi:hypothetical protein
MAFSDTGFFGLHPVARADRCYFGRAFGRVADQITDVRERMRMECGCAPALAR